MNIEELLVAKGIHYIPKGNDYEIRCLNPEHEDKHPSLRIDKITGVFHCLSCGFKGNIFSHFNEVVNFLDLKREVLKRKIISKKAENIGLNMPSDAAKYEGDWRGISQKTYDRFEAFTSLASDFKNRVCFPIRDISGKIVVFNGRHTSGGLPKYKIHPPGAKIPLFPAKVTPVRSSIILVEGIYDMLNLYDKGLQNVICTHGTRNINTDKLAMLKLQGIEKIFIFFDGDDPGQDAAKEVASMCEKAGLLHKNIQWTGKDPGELTQEQVNSVIKNIYP